MKKEPSYVKVGAAEAEASVWEVLEWWEKRRWNFTILLFALQAMIIYYRYAFTRFNIWDSIFESTLFVIGAQVAYCAGWGIELLLRYYFPTIRFNSILRYTLWGLGIFLILLLTAPIYRGYSYF